MANIYKNLHLEDIEIPENYIEIMNNDGQWEFDDFDSFSLIIQETQKGVDYGFDLYPFEDESEDMNALNKALEEKGYELLGYGWEDYLMNYITIQNPLLSEKISPDSEGTTCGLYLNETLEEYKIMLELISQAIGALLP